MPRLKAIFAWPCKTPRERWIFRLGYVLGALQGWRLRLAWDAYKRVEVGGDLRREGCPICEFNTAEAGTCPLAPPGWFCTLEAGHDGPCPTWPEHHRAVANA